MQTLNFNCSFCGKLMAVGMNLLGRNVRCPHCKQVVQAPASSLPPLAAPSIPEPSFQVPSAPKESHESIFGEVHDDDLFGGTHQPKVLLPEPPPQPPTQRVEIEPTVQMPQEPLGMAYSVHSPPAARTESAPEYTPPNANPWDAPAPASRHTAPPEPARSERFEPMPYSPRERSSGGGGIFIFILLVYSAAATAGVAYLYFNRTTGGDKSNNAQKAHPFAAIPDFFGQYDKANRKEVVRLNGMPDANLDVPDKLRVTVKNTLPLGNIEVTPTRIEYRDVLRFDKKPGGAKFEPKTLARPLFLLHLRVKNASTDIVLHPTDPAFNALYRNEQPYTGIFVGGEKFLGGPWFWPDSQYERQYVEGQEKDDKPLGPGEEREYVIASTIDSNTILNHLRQIKDNEPAVWHVQLRSGLVACRDESGKERQISMTSVIGVPFTIADVQFPR